MANEDLAMENNKLSQKYEISLQKSVSLEIENQELRKELDRLKSHIQFLDNQIKSRDFAVAGASSPSKIPAPATYIREPTPPQKKKQRTATPAPAVAPPPPRPLSAEIRWVPEVVELYGSLTKKEAENPDYDYTMKAKIEEFVNWWTKKVNTEAPRDIIAVEKLVKWLDEELSLMVDDQAVLKRFSEWPEEKVRALREAALRYRELKNLEDEVSLFRDNPQEEVNVVLRRAHALQIRLEKRIRNLESTRELDSNKYKNFQIPCQWMLDSGLPSQMKLSSQRLAKEFMQRTTKEIHSNETGQSDKLFLQALRFANRVHQYAGGFDSEAMKAFEELKKVGLGTQRQI